MTYSQKWSLVSFIEPVDVGTEFYWKDWPLHVTLASVFAIEWEDDLVNELQETISSHAPLLVTATEKAYWGENKEYHCMLLERCTELMNLHMKIHNLLLQYGAVFNEPEHHGEGYIPHSTIEKNTRLHIGDQVVLNSLSIVDMFPNHDHEQRRVTQIFTFDGE